MSIVVLIDAMSGSAPNDQRMCSRGDHGAAAGVMQRVERAPIQRFRATVVGRRITVRSYCSQHGSRVMHPGDGSMYRSVDLAVSTVAAQVSASRFMLKFRFRVCLDRVFHLT